MSHRAHVINGVRHAARCCCPACDPKGLVAAAYRERAAAERRAAAAVRAAAGLPEQTVVQPVRVSRPALPSRGPDRRMKRFVELRALGKTPDEAHAQIEIEEKEGFHDGQRR